MLQSIGDRYKRPLLNNEDLSPFSKFPLHQGSYRLYASKEIQDPHNLPFLLDSEERMETNLLKARYEELHQKALPILMEISSWSVIAKLVQEGLGVGLFPDYIASANPDIKPVLSELNPMEYTLYALFERNTEPNVHTQKFLDLFSKFPLKYSI